MYYLPLAIVDWTVDPGWTNQHCCPVHLELSLESSVVVLSCVSLGHMSSHEFGLVDRITEG